MKKFITIFDAVQNILTKIVIKIENTEYKFHQLIFSDACIRDHEFFFIRENQPKNFDECVRLFQAAGFDPGEIEDVNIRHYLALLEQRKDMKFLESSCGIITKNMDKLRTVLFRIDAFRRDKSRRFFRYIASLKSEIRKMCDMRHRSQAFCQIVNIPDVLMRRMQMEFEPHVSHKYIQDFTAVIADINENVSQVCISHNTKAFIIFLGFVNSYFKKRQWKESLCKITPDFQVKKLATCVQEFTSNI